MPLGRRRPRPAHATACQTGGTEGAPRPTARYHQNHHRRCGGLLFVMVVVLLACCSDMMMPMGAHGFVMPHHRGRLQQCVRQQQQPHQQRQQRGRQQAGLVMRVTRPPWQGGGRRGRRKQQEEDDLWLLEKQLLGPAAEAQPQPKQQQHQEEEVIEGEDDDDIIAARSASHQQQPQPHPHPHQHQPHQEPQAVEVLVVEAGEAGQRVDRFLAAKLEGQSRSACGELCDAGLVLVGRSRARKSAKLGEGEVVEVLAVRAAAPVELAAEAIPLDVLYEDAHVIAVNKPPGMVVHPAPGNRNGTFVNALLHHVGAQLLLEAGAGGAEGRPGVVHRLDKGTSGVLIAAKTAAAHAALSAAFAERRVRKTYLAVCIGSPGEEAVIDAPIGRHPKDRQRMAVAMTTGDFSPREPRVAHHEEAEGDGEEEEEEEDEDEEEGPDTSGAYDGELLMGKGGRTGATPLVGRAARSTVRTLAFDGRLGVVEVGIETGRTHQIRVHLQHRRHPVLGDELYGNAQWNGRARRRWGVERPMLHALRLELAHPVTGETLQLVAPVPADMRKVVEGVWPQIAHEAAGRGLEPNSPGWWERVLASESQGHAEEEALDEDEDEDEGQDASSLSKEEQEAERRRQMEEAGLDEFGWPVA